MININKQRYHEIINLFIHNVTAPRNRILLLFTIEGILITLVNNIVGNNNNLFATRLGASDYELSLVTTLPQIIGMLVLIPGGILTDRMANKRRMVTASLALITVFYAVIGFVPFLSSYRLIIFLILIALSTGPMTIYNVSWQAYFSDIVNIEDRNSILTYRTSFTFLISIIIPLASGAILASAGTVGAKLRIHQAYFWMGAVMLLIQIFVLRQIKSSQEHSPSGLGIKNLKSALLELLHNKKFLGFVSVALFFYMTWQIDWTLYFIGQVKYLKMNEAWLSYVNIGGAVAQFLTIGFWSRLNVKYGVRFGIIFGTLGLSVYPIGMIMATSAPAAQGRVVFIIMHTIASLTMAVITLNVLQCLLQILPEKNKTLNISIYTVLITLSNAVMPLVGIMLYTHLGADLKALQTIFWIIFAARIVSTGLWTLRWWVLRKEV
ncbi:MAG TPA: MFS transporter [Mobilitalea sp.]|nr:MFS transporter [Mobilitalea sp.]